MAHSASPFCTVTHTQGTQASHRRPFVHTSRIHLKQRHQCFSVRPCARRRPPDDPIIFPYILPSHPKGELQGLQRFLRSKRIIIVGYYLDDIACTQLVATLLALDALDPITEIRLYINYSAGSPYAVAGLVDVIRSIHAPVSTIGLGTVGGALAVLLACGTKGRRFVTTNTRVRLEEQLGGAGGSSYDVNIQAAELSRTMYMMYEYLADATGLPRERFEEECDRMQYISATQAKELGLVDDIIGGPPTRFYPDVGRLGLIYHKFKTQV